MIICWHFKFLHIMQWYSENIKTFKSVLVSNLMSLPHTLQPNKFQGCCKERKHPEETQENTGRACKRHSQCACTNLKSGPRAAKGRTVHILHISQQNKTLPSYLANCTVRTSPYSSNSSILLIEVWKPLALINVSHDFYEVGGFHKKTCHYFLEM